MTCNIFNISQAVLIKSFLQWGWSGWGQRQGHIHCGILPNEALCIFISSRVESVEVEKPDGSVVTYPVGFIETQMDFYSPTGKTVKT